MHRIFMARSFVRGKGVHVGVDGMSYVMVSVAKWAMTCVSGNGPLCGVRFWYQLVSGKVSMVTVVGLCLAANRAQCIACRVASWLCGCA